MIFLIDKECPNSDSIEKWQDGPSQVRETTFAPTCDNRSIAILTKLALFCPVSPSIKKQPSGTFQDLLMQTAIITKASFATGDESSSSTPQPRSTKPRYFSPLQATCLLIAISSSISAQTVSCVDISTAHFIGLNASSVKPGSAGTAVYHRLTVLGWGSARLNIFLTSVKLMRKTLTL